MIRPKSWYHWRMLALILVHVYIVFHMVAWYFFDFKIWGKTAMMGVPSLISGNINAAAIMVILILSSILIFGRSFCGWACHLRGSLEFADWVMRKMDIKGYNEKRKKNVLVNTRYRWMFRIGALYVLFAPVFLRFLKTREYNVKVDVMSPAPMADLPGHNNQLFLEGAPVNMEIAQHGLNVPDFLLALGTGLGIIFVMTFFLNYFYGQGAFCRLLCPYATLFVPLMNKLPWQKKITRVDQCTGCRDCSNACPQGIDVSREIYHYDGKVINLECIKCYACIDACDHGVLADTNTKAVPQILSRKEYDKKPWTNERKNLQVLEDINPALDFSSFVFSLICGAITSKFGGFHFYIGSIIGFVFARKLFIPYVFSMLKKLPVLQRKKLDVMAQGEVKKAS